MKRILIREIPDKLHMEFKRYCFNLGISMNRKLKELMERVVREGDDDE